ncbi:MAG TPA: DUF4145 domain-containing protein [Puia sp.]|nr:DUF4145 domain-containing protein [Puia sp.]
MDRKIWKTEYFEYSVTPWLCSDCPSSNLSVKEKPIVNSNDYYTTHLVCPQCHKEYATTGNVGYFTYGVKVSKQYEGQKYKRFYPNFFNPCLRLFQLNKSIPSEIIADIDQSFSAYWSDTSSSANAIRRSLETLLDKLEVPKANSLHQRIELYQHENKEIADCLLAIKWIGNSGSHGTPLTKDDLLDAYGILEHCLNNLYPSPDKEDIHKLVEQINRRRGTRSGETLT